MKREIRFKIYLQHEDTGNITSKDFDYASIFSGAAKRSIKTSFKRYFIINKMEFTGFRDKRGIRIFDKDKVECNGVIYDVVWETGKAVELHNKEHKQLFFLFDYFNIVRIIGNTYDK